ncbi:O-antigen ligase family protein [uncultured Psychroserpens sp.]|uniref:O-antigen ligase family protein n=1 Tax=uncultured Psychroserpens sp. TaxID=255436 RepID=UPI00262A877A|nr:O-antigen ligase family protein [uncultured Psychroserpens sp.]
MGRLGSFNKDNYLGLVVLHIIFGVAIYFFTPLSRLYFIIAFVYFLWKILFSRQERKTVEVLLACSYFTGIEVFFRMTDGGIAYEASKYLVILFMLLGMFFKGMSGRGYPYFIYLILLVPSILVASMTLGFSANFRTAVAFVLSGPVCLGIAALFCYDRRISRKHLLQCVNYIALPSITMTVYLFLYNPSIKDTLSGTASNAATSGGFGPNQVSTALGLGMFAIVVRLFMKSPSIFLKVLNLVILGGMTFRAIVTFSRGGVFAAIIVVAAFLTIYFIKSSPKRKQQIAASFMLFLVAIAITWFISSIQTFGLIDKRYSNQDSLGRDKGDITTGRLDLFEEEIEGFLDSPFLGIGISKTQYIRVERDGKRLPSHNEVGRLLSEHGILGITILLILIIKPFAYRAANKRNVYFYAFFCFWFATINHSGMRIAAPALLYGMSLLNVVYEKNPVHRKQVRKQIK